MQKKYMLAFALTLAGCSEKEWTPQPDPQGQRMAQYQIPDIAAQPGQAHPVVNNQEGQSFAPDARTEIPASPQVVAPGGYIVRLTRTGGGTEIVPTEILEFSRQSGYREITTVDNRKVTFAIKQDGQRVTGEMAGINFLLPRADGSQGLFFHNQTGQTEIRNIVAMGQIVGTVSVQNNSATSYTVNMRLKAPYSEFNTATNYTFDQSGQGMSMVAVNPQKGLTITAERRS